MTNGRTKLGTFQWGGGGGGGGSFNVNYIIRIAMANRKESVCRFVFSVASVGSKLAASVATVVSK